jgi:hypothetical protein
MEKKDNRNTAYNAAPQENWQEANNEGNWQLAEASEEDTVSLLTTDTDDPDYPEPLYATGGDEDEKQENEENDSDEDEDEDGDWGNVDPQSDPVHPGPPDPMDPSGPGSAV